MAVSLCSFPFVQLSLSWVDCTSVVVLGFAKAGDYLGSLTPSIVLLCPFVYMEVSFFPHNLTLVLGHFCYSFWSYTLHYSMCLFEETDFQIHLEEQIFT